MYFLIITISSCLANVFSLVIFIVNLCSESCSALRNIHSFVHLGAWVIQPLFSYSLLVDSLDGFVDSVNKLVRELIAAEGQAEVIWCDSQARLNSLLAGIVYVVQADVEVLELWIDL